MNDQSFARRLVLIVLLMLGAFSGLGFRLIWLHAGFQEDLSARVKQIRRYTKTLQVSRGRIYDRSGNLLALDLPTRHVCADPQRLQELGHVGFTATQLARVLELDRDEVLQKLKRPGRRYARLKRFVPLPVVAQIEQMKLKGVFFEEAVQREYPHASAMCHVLGFMNWQGDGCGGIEQVMQEYLRGRPGLRISEKDGRRIELYSRRVLDIEPRQGADIQLTLDENIQFMVERTLDRLLEEHGPAGAWAAVQRIETGEILALASRPNYDLNAFRFSTPEQQRNRMIGMVYEPGSTFKTVVIAAALNEGLVTPGQVIDCENGIWHYGGRPLRDSHGYKELTVADVLKKSSNIGAAKIALAMGEEKLADYMKAFGFGRPTGIDLPGEEAGILHPVKNWSAISATRLAMGHEISVTGLQMLNAVSAIANDGYLMRPTIIRRIADSQGRVLYESEPEVLGRPIDARTSRLMRKLMERVTQTGGTGRRARIDECAVAGKTGTAQKAVPGGYSQDDYIASFVGFLPVNEPEVAIIVVADSPGPLYYGGQVAAPAFRDIAAETVRYMRVADPSVKQLAFERKPPKPNQKEQYRDTGSVM